MRQNSPKLQRWTDLLAALLRRRYPASFDELRREVPAYHAHKGPVASLMRKFERDKDELRAFGVPIETIAGADGNVSLYRLQSAAFYLPYLQLATDTHPPKRPKGIGYQGLPILAFEPDELAAVVAAARRVQQIGDPVLSREAANALRKIAHDVPIGDNNTNEIIVRERGLDEQVFNELTRAVRERKTVTFNYYSIRRDDRSARRVDPYGIAYVSNNWYLIGHDHDADAIRQFRARRISDAALNPKAPQTPDFVVPQSFDLWDYTRSRQAWELGDAEARTVTVQFNATRGHLTGAMRLGAPAGGDASRRVFRVRRVDSFLRWVLGFAGAAAPVEPADVVPEYQALIRSTLALYE